jgi:hypothetical protein
MRVGEYSFVGSLTCRVLDLDGLSKAGAATAHPGWMGVEEYSPLTGPTSSTGKRISSQTLLFIFAFLFKI